MKNVMSRKSIITICISITIVLIAVLISTCFSNLSKSNNQLPSFENLQSANPSSDASTMADYIEGIDKDAYIAGTSVAACTFAAAIFQNKSDIYEVNKVEPPENFTHLYTSNLSQSYYNSLLRLNYGIRANGTCSLIAMIIASDALGINNQLGLPDPNSVEGRLVILKELVEISNKYGNTYDGSDNGTSAYTIPIILQEFYSNHGHSLNLSNILLKDDLRKNVEAKKQQPSIISFFNYETTMGDAGSAHTVALVGTYKIRLRYKKLKYGVNQWGDFNAFVICDGWKNNSDGEIGDNYQILIFNTNVKDAIYLVNLT